MGKQFAGDQAGDDVPDDAALTCQVAVDGEVCVTEINLVHHGCPADGLCVTCLKNVLRLPGIRWGR